LRLARKHWQGGTVPSAKQRREKQTRRIFSPSFSQEAGRYENAARIENGGPDFHRQVDTQGFVFAEREALSARAVAPPTRKRLPTDAYQNSSQSRIDRINRQARDEVEGHCGRVFLDPTGKDARRSTQRYVPLGKTIPQERDCGRASCGSVSGAMKLDVSLSFRGFERKPIQKRRTV
jgi:hypothetical protein